MGKIRVKTLGVEELEQKQKKETKKRKEGKKALSADRQVVKGAKGGERVVAVGPSEKELARLDELSARQAQIEALEKAKLEELKEKPKKAVKVKKPKRVRSKKYQEVKKLVDRTKKYKLADALKLLPKLKMSKLDETVELHINTAAQGISGTVTLPHGTGKTIKVAIATDELIEQIEKGLPATPSQASGLRGGRGKINFDVLLAAPSMMPKLAKVAKFLGPRGLMPNPKNGTLTNDPEKEALKFQKGQVRFKTEAKSPIMHLVVGKLSFGPKKLEENINTIINAIKKENIKNTVLKSTMSPGIKLEL